METKNFKSRLVSLALFGLMLAGTGIPSFADWYEEDGNRYYLAENGEVVRKSTVIDGVRFKFDSSGVCKGTYTGWTRSKNGRQYWKDGVLQTDRWLAFKSGKYYFAGKNGYVRTGWAAVTRGEGNYSYFDKNGVWDGKTYYIGYQPENLRHFLTDFDLFSESGFVYAFNNHSPKNKKSFDGIDIVREIIEADLDSPLSYDERPNDCEIELSENIYHGGKKIIIGCDKGTSYDLEFTQDKDGNSYLYSSWFGFGLKLSESNAYSRILDEIDSEKELLK